GTGQLSHRATPGHIPVVECDGCPVTVGFEDDPGRGVLHRHEGRWLVLGGERAALLPGDNRFDQRADRLQINVAASTHTLGLIADCLRAPESIPDARQVREICEYSPDGSR